MEAKPSTDRIKLYAKDAYDALQGGVKIEREREIGKLAIATTTTTLTLNLDLNYVYYYKPGRLS